MLIVYIKSNINIVHIKINIIYILEYVLRWVVQEFEAVIFFIKLSLYVMIHEIYNGFSNGKLSVFIDKKYIKNASYTLYRLH